MLQSKFVKKNDKYKYISPKYRYFQLKHKHFTNLEDGDRGADDEDEDVSYGEVDEEHVDHGLEAGARGHRQDDLGVTKCQL